MHLLPMTSRRMRCHYCFGRGCEECGDTGERWTHRIDVDGGHAIVHGNAELTPDQQFVIAEVLKMAFAKMDGDNEQ